MEINSSAFWVAIAQIIWINVLLSGDNAVVIAMACRSLSERARLWGMILGAGVAVILRIIFTFIVTTLMEIQFLKAAGALALLYIAVDLIKPKGHEKRVGERSRHALESDDHDRHCRPRHESRQRRGDRRRRQGQPAAADHRPRSSIPMIIAGSAIIMTMLDRFPLLVWAGAALLGWIAGELFVTDVGVVSYLGAARAHALEYPFAIGGAVIVVAIGAWLRYGRRPQAVADQHQGNG